MLLNKDKSILKLVPKHPIPRYTSYPTVPNFHSKIDQNIYKKWLKNINSKEKISLYIHIPFCNSLCYFCGCHTCVVNKYGPIKNYVDYLLIEIGLIASKLKFKSKVSHIHFGGGSPSILKPNELISIMNLIKKKFNIIKNCEIVMEIDPRFFPKGNFTKVLKNLGFTRMSIGIQDFSLKVQKNINRKQTFKQTKELIDHLRLNDITVINIDLIYGLPFQTIKSFITTLNKINSLKPDRISIFGYAHVPWMKKHQKLIKGKILNNEKRLQLYRLASDYFLNKNYIAIGIDHYAKQNSSIVKKLKNKKLQRNFQGYTEDEAKTLIGVGSSSISSLSEGYVQNITYIPNYIESLKKNKLPILRGCKFKNKDKMYGTIIKELMCYLSVNLNEIIHEFNKENEPNIFFRELFKVKPFIDKGFVNIKNDILLIKPEARPLVRTICSSFDQYFKVNKNKYSLGI